ncbi:MAG: HAD family phosphatase [Elainellaceae cyanobacterium]
MVDAQDIDVQSIDAIIFDLGGVILNIAYDRTIAAFSQLAGQDIRYLYSQHLQVDLFDAYEIGHISSEQFRQKLRSLLGLGRADYDISDGILDAAWNAMLLDLPPSRLNVLQTLRKRFRLILLSNTNEIHKTAFEQHLSETVGQSSALAGCFDAVYYSHLIGDRKPNSSLFQRVVDEQRLVPSRTLFVDDTAGHLCGAQAVGIKAMHMTSGLTLEALADELLAIE